MYLRSFMATSSRAPRWALAEYDKGPGRLQPGAQISALQLGLASARPRWFCAKQASFTAEPELGVAPAAHDL